MIPIFFWVLLLIWLVGGFVARDNRYYIVGMNFLLFILFVLVGLTIYHNPLTR
jgi:hypothetical protein